MARSDLDLLISDLDDLETHFDEKFQKQYDDIIAKLFLLIGKTTAYDTMYARNIIQSILADLGRSDLQPQLEKQIYEFWNKRKRRIMQGGYHTLTKEGGNYSVVVEDEGFANQNRGKVSDIHPRHDEEVKPFNVEYALDKLTLGGDEEIEKAFTILEDMIIKAIEKGGR